MNSNDEYQTLRQEILDSYNREVNIATFGFTATAAILGYGFTTENLNPLIFLLPILILALMLVQFNNCIYTVLTISVYIRVFIETKNDGPQWETTIDALRDYLRKQKGYSPVTIFTEFHYAVASILMGGICIFLAFRYDTSHQYYTISTLIAMLWLIWCIRMFRPLKHANSGLFEKKLRIIYKQIKAERADLAG